MKQEQLSPYQLLIHSLLDCEAADEQWTILRQKAALVDFELIRTMEQVAQQQVREGKHEQGNHLHQLAGQIYHLLTQDECMIDEPETRKVYDSLIYKFLKEVPSDQNCFVLPASLYSLAPKLISRMQQIAENFAEEGELKIAEKIWHLSENMSRQLFWENWPLQDPAK